MFLSRGAFCPQRNRTFSLVLLGHFMALATFQSLLFRRPPYAQADTSPVSEDRAPLQTPPNRNSVLTGTAPRHRPPSVSPIAAVREADNGSGASAMPSEIVKMLSRENGMATPREQLAREIEELRSYETKITTTLAKNEEPDTSMTLLDMRYARHIVAMKNANNKDLHLNYFSDPDDLSVFIEKQIPFTDHKNSKISKAERRSEIRFLALVNIKGKIRTSGRQTADDHLEPHHVIVDVSIKKGKASLIVLEPVNMAADVPEHAASNLDNSLTKYNLNAVFSYISVGAQRSQADCVTFCIAFADKIHKNRARFDKIHKDQRSAPANKATYIFNDKFIESKKNYRTSVNMVQRASFIRRLDHAVDATPDARHFLDIAFYKHMGSARSLNELIDRRPEVANIPVNKKGQTLKQRVSEHALTEPRTISRLREDVPVLVTTTDSNSIEKKRLLYAQKAIAFFEGLRDMLETDVENAKDETT
jgi:hypothetical protein